MKLYLLPFIRDILNVEDTFKSDDFSSKNKSVLFGLFRALNLIEMTGKHQRSIIYKKTEKFKRIKDQFQRIKSEEILQLAIVFLVLDVDIPLNSYNGKKIKLFFKKASTVVTHLLFQTGMLQKEKRTYKYTPLFEHLCQQNSSERETLLNALISNYNKLDQKLYLDTSRSLRYGPDYVSISFDHGISIKTTWVIKYWNVGKNKNKEILLNDLAQNNKSLIMFESDRSTRKAKAYITVFPRVENN